MLRPGVEREEGYGCRNVTPTIGLFFIAALSSQCTALIWTSAGGDKLV